MTVSEVLKNVHSGFVHFAILESPNSTESMYENIDTIKNSANLFILNFHMHWKN